TSATPGTVATRFVQRLFGKPTLAVSGQSTSGKSGVRLLGVGRLPLHAGAVALRGFVHGVGAPVQAPRAVAGADREDQARPVSGADDHMIRPRRAVQEVPPAQRALLTFDDGQRLPGEHEEVL